MVFTYHDGVLISILFKLQQPLTETQVKALFADIHYLESSLKQSMSAAGVIVEAITPKRTTLTSTQDKIAMFCRYYKSHVGLSYRVSRADSGMIKAVDVTEKLLTTYFTSESVLFKNHYSIGNYTKFFNQLCAEAFGTNEKSGLPNTWNAKFASKLSGPQLSQYFRHLHSKGLVARKNSLGEIIDFIPSNGPQ